MEYLPNEGLLGTSSFLFIELTTDASGTSTGFALRYQGERYHGDADEMTQKSRCFQGNLRFCLVLKVGFSLVALAAV